MKKCRLKAFLQKGNRATWCVFFLFAFSIFLKCTLFHWFCFHSLAISSLWTNPIAFWAFWLFKIAISIFIAGFVFITKRQIWTVVLSVIIDIWIIANMVYYRANGLFISIEEILMANNMDGFWTSVLLYLSPKMWLFPLITLLYSICIYFLRTKGHQLRVYLYSLLISCILFVMGTLAEITMLKRNNAIDHNINISTHYIPFHISTFSNVLGMNNRYSEYINTHSIVSYFPAHILSVLPHLISNNTISLSANETLYLKEYCSSPDSTQINPTDNLIVILVESLESWPIDMLNVTPNLQKAIDEQHSLYVDKISSQVKHGVSGDGQMIANTGLLPIQSGAACVLYANHTFPNVAHFYPYSQIIIPTTPIVWNQGEASEAYQYQLLTYPPQTEKQGWSDADLFEALDENLLSASTSKDIPFIIFAVTISTHSPFDRIQRDYPELDLPKDTPETLKRYLTCLHYTDSCIGAFMDKFMQSDLANNTAVVITGDHTIFKEAMLGEFIPFAKKHNLSIQNGKNYCPLIIWSPSITEPIRIKDVCYQMDIYPTILSLIGAEDYYWKGFGVNLLDSAARQNRPISEEEAYILSDKLIRSNWFANRK